MASEAKRALAQQLMAYAEGHYEDGGWDVIVECWSEEDIIAQIGKARTLAGAIKKFAWLVDVWADRQADAINSAF